MIYFIHAPALELVKIGCTTGNPARRLAMLQTGCPCKLVLLATMDGGQKDERELHVRFAEYRTRGEWFCYAAPIRELVNELGPAAVTKRTRQADLAQMSGLSEPYVSQLLSGKRVSLPAMLHLYRTTGVRVPHLADADEHTLRSLAEKIPYPRPL